MLDRGSCQAERGRGWFRANQIAIALMNHCRRSWGRRLRLATEVLQHGTLTSMQCRVTIRMQKSLLLQCLQAALAYAQVQACSLLTPPKAPPFIGPYVQTTQAQHLYRNTADRQQKGRAWRAGSNPSVEVVVFPEYFTQPRLETHAGRSAQS